MYMTSYRREVCKEQYERPDVFEEPEEPQVPPPEHSRGAGLAGIPVQGMESLQELNERFARCIGRARMLEQRNAVFRKQLEMLQHVEEVSGLGEACSEQISLHRQRLRELSSEQARLDRERHEAERKLEDFSSRYRNECEYQQRQRDTLEHLNKEADAALLRNLEYQVQSQFLQDDINSTRDRNKKNLAEIQTYVKILKQITLVPQQLHSVSQKPSELERPFGQSCVPSLQSQLDEYKTALCQLEAQKQRLQDETSTLEQAARTTQESYDEEIRLCGERIESLRKEIEEAERSLEKYTNKCRQLAMYQTSLENKLECYRTIIENEGTRLNSVIIETPIALLTADNRYTPMTSVTSRGRDFTQAVQDITNVKPRQKNLAKKVLRMQEISPKNVRNSEVEEKAGVELEDVAEDGEERVTDAGQSFTSPPVSPEDVPDGTQISKAIDTLCNIIQERMHQHARQEPIADFYAEGRYVLVSGESSYIHPSFCSSSSSGGHVFVTICDGRMFPNYTEKTLCPIPAPVSPTCPEDGEEVQGSARWQTDHEDNGVGNNEEAHLGEKYRGSQPRPKHPRSKTPDKSSCRRGHGTPDTWNIPPSVPSMSYEKVEVVESVEKISGDNKVGDYEETATIVETIVEKTSKKKPMGWSP
ncbi:filensin [Brienomyrus brachyistius]|uniref:filensin n=1 Tax=Brienomyrus brachyistius TaxID=42636 RepID=UPI0020B3A4FB|nr:filensin [Brienomyrus brachyistius]